MNSLRIAYIHCYQDLVVVNLKVFFLYKKMAKYFLPGCADVSAER